MSGCPSIWCAARPAQGASCPDSNDKLAVLDRQPGAYLWESNAIRSFLARRGLPGRSRARMVLQWQSFEQHGREPCIAVARFTEQYLGLANDRRAE